MNKKEIAEVYAEIGDEEYYRFNMRGWQNAVLCYNVAITNNPAEVKYFAKLIHSYIAIEKYYVLNLIPGKKYLKKAKNEIHKILSIRKFRNNFDLKTALAYVYYVDNNFIKAEEILSGLDPEKIKKDFFALLLKLKLDDISDEDYVIDYLDEFSESQNSYIYNVLAGNSMKIENYEDALDYLNMSLMYKKNNPFTYNKLGLCYYYMGRYNSSVTAYKTAIKLIPDFAKAHYNMGKSRMGLDNIGRAHKSYESAIRANPYMYTAYNDIGVLYYKKDMYLSSIESYKKAIALNPFYYVAYNNLGISLKEIENYHESEIAYRKAIKLNPNYSQAHNNLGTLLNKLGRHEESIICYKKALHINPKYRNAYLNLERVYELIESKYYV